MVEVRDVTSVTPDIVSAMNHLLPQLSNSAPPLTEEKLTAIVASPTTALFAAFSDDRMVGALTLAVFTIPTGVRAWIEDVVVDENARGLGVGKALTLAAMERAKACGARTIELTSRPSREAAHRLYESLGFQIRETNVYRITLDT
jgi:ribosomal protein S18 acetylase RimI-like enzyme